MSLLDDIKGNAEELIGGNAEAVKGGIEKPGDFIDEKTGGKFADQVNGVQQAASDFVGGLGQGNSVTEPTDAAPAQESVPVAEQLAPAEAAAEGA